MEDAKTRLLERTLRHWLYTQMSDGYLYKHEFLDYGKHSYHWKPIPENILFKHGEPIARFIVKNKK